MADTVEQIIAKAKASTEVKDKVVTKQPPLSLNTDTNVKEHELTPIEKIESLKGIKDYVERSNALRDANKKYTLEMIDKLFPQKSTENMIIVPDREYALLFAEIVNYDYIRCKYVFESAELLKEVINVGIPKLMIYKGIKDGKMDIQV